MTLKQLTGSTANTYREYIQRNLPEGVSMKVKSARDRLKKIFTDRPRIDFTVFWGSLCLQSLPGKTALIMKLK